MRAWLLRLLGGWWLPRAEVVRVGPDDVIVVSVPEMISPAQADELRRLARAVFPENRVLVLIGGVKISVYQDGGDP